MTNILPPTFPTLPTGALFQRTISMPTNATGYHDFAVVLARGALAKGQALAASNGWIVQTDVDTRYPQDGSACRVRVLIAVPSQASASPVLVAFSATTAGTTSLALTQAIGNHSLAIDATPTADLTILPSTACTTSTTFGGTMFTVADTSGLQPGMAVVADGLPTWAAVNTVESSTQFQVWGALASGVTPSTVSVNLTQRMTSPWQADLIAALKAASTPLLTRSGPLVVTAKTQVTRLDGANGMMRAVGWLSFFADGTMSAVVQVAADITDTVAATSQSPPRDGRIACYSAVISIDGVSKSVGPLEHWFAGKWVARIGATPQGIGVADPRDLTGSDAIRTYKLAGGVTPGAFARVQGVSPYSPMGDTCVTEYMPGVGGRDDIGPDFLPDEIALLTQDPICIRVANDAADVAGSIPWHFWNPATGNYWSPYDQISNNTSGWSLWTNPVDPQYNVVPAGSTASPWAVDPAHMPDLVYLPYLASGDDAWADELAAEAMWVLVGQWPWTRGPTGDVILKGEQVRGSAWAFRTLLYAAFALPDYMPEKAAATKALMSNVAFLHSQTVKSQVGPTKGLILGVYGSSEQVQSPWQTDYMAVALGIGARMGVPGLEDYLDTQGWHWLIGRFFHGQDGFGPADAFTYNVAFANPNGTGDVPFYETWAQVGQGTFNYGQSNYNADGTLDPSYPHARGDYGMLAMGTLADAAGQGVPGAQAALDWMAASGAPFTSLYYFENQPYFNTQVQTPAGNRYFGAAPYTWTYEPPTAAITPLSTAAWEKIAIAPVTSTLIAGATLTLTGALTATGAGVEVGLSRSATVPPGIFVPATITGALWSADVTLPTTADTYYAHAHTTDGLVSATPIALTVAGSSGGTTQPPTTTPTGAVSITAAPSSVTAGLSFGISGTVSPAGTPVQAYVSGETPVAASVSGWSWTATLTASSVGNLTIGADTTLDTATPLALTVTAAPSTSPTTSPTLAQQLAAMTATATTLETALTTIVTNLQSDKVAITTAIDKQIAAVQAVLTSVGAV